MHWETPQVAPCIPLKMDWAGIGDGWPLPLLHLQSSVLLPLETLSNHLRSLIKSTLKYLPLLAPAIFLQLNMRYGQGLECQSCNSLTALRWP